ncbi:B-cell receptor CD22-like [Etheostoma spectabile]|uniref:B-cell receptor CD22-like n=1 Tax=Etheostoma spectabile TaxID=54343 RepID=UPI0013AF4E04|nr:B-cell receptor CD22-like [Etheostoma spectabile]
MASTLSFTPSAELFYSVSDPLTKEGSSQPSSATQSLDVLYTLRVPVATLVTPGPVSEGGTVTFTCWSDANPPVSFYTWYRAVSGKLTKKGEEEMQVLRGGGCLCDAQSTRGSKRAAARVLFPTTYVECRWSYVITVAVDVYNISRRLKEAEGKHPPQSEKVAGSQTRDSEK